MVTDAGMQVMRVSVTQWTPSCCWVVMTVSASDHLWLMGDPELVVVLVALVEIAVVVDAVVVVAAVVVAGAHA